MPLDDPGNVAQVVRSSIQRARDTTILQRNITASTSLVTSNNYKLSAIEIPLKAYKLSLCTTRRYERGGEDLWCPRENPLHVQSVVGHELTGPGSVNVFKTKTMQINSLLMGYPILLWRLEGWVCIPPTLSNFQTSWQRSRLDIASWDSLLILLGSNPVPCIL